MTARRPSAKAAPKDPAAHFEQRLIKALGRRELSAATARARLLAWGAPAPLADAIIRALVSRAILDDRRAAEGFVRAALDRAPAGRALLLPKLAAHGIDSALAASVVDAALRDHTPAAQARRLCREALARTPRREDPLKTRRRLAALLARRGFDEDTVATAVDAALGPAPLEE